jgi:hypothetical protein
MPRGDRRLDAAGTRPDHFTGVVHSGPSTVTVTSPLPELLPPAHRQGVVVQPVDVRLQLIGRLPRHRSRAGPPGPQSTMTGSYVRWRVVVSGRTITPIVVWIGTGPKSRES